MSSNQIVTRATFKAYAGFWLLLACIDYLAFPLMFLVNPRQAPFVGATVFPVIGAQIGLVATWGVFSSARFGQRMVICAIVGLALFSCFALGMATASRLATGGPPSDAIVLVLSVCPLVFFAVQLPLWAARVWLQWQVVASQQPPRGSYLSPVGIRDIILGTALASVALTLVRLKPWKSRRRELAEGR